MTFSKVVVYLRNEKEAITFNAVFAKSLINNAIAVSFFYIIKIIRARNVSSCFKWYIRKFIFFLILQSGGLYFKYN